MLARNSAGQTKKSITYAVTYIGWAGGNAVAPQIFQAKWKPRYLNSLYIHLGLCRCILAFLHLFEWELQRLIPDGVFIITVLYTRWMLVKRNKKKEAAQASEGTPDNLRAFEVS